MIDWLSMTVYVPHTEPVGDGQVLSISPDGEVEWTTLKRHKLAGSHDTNLTVRTVIGSGMQRLDGTTEYQYLEISGNPAKFFQGHNLWGTDDVHGLAIETALHVCNHLGLELGPHLPELWINSHGPNEGESGVPTFWLTRVDYTAMFLMPSEAHAVSLVRLIGDTGTLKHRGKAEVAGETTVYFAKRSRRSTLKVYAKGPELRKHPQPIVDELPQAIDYGRRSVRVELTRRSMDLEARNQRGLRHYRMQDQTETLGNTLEHLGTMLRDMTMTTRTELPPEALEELSSAQRTAYYAWSHGEDLRQLMPKRSFYRLRRILLRHGIDIATTVPRSIPDNVVSLYDSLVPQLATVPDWAIGTPLYFEPRRRFA